MFVVIAGVWWFCCFGGWLFGGCFLLFWTGILWLVIAYVVSLSGLLCRFVVLYFSLCFVILLLWIIACLVRWFGFDIEAFGCLGFISNVIAWLDCLVV